MFRIVFIFICKFYYVSCVGCISMEQHIFLVNKYTKSIKEVKRLFASKRLVRLISQQRQTCPEKQPTNKNMFVAVEPVRHVQEMLMVYPLNISDVFYCSRLAGVNSTFRAVYPRRIKSRSFSCQSTEDYSVWPQFRFGSIIC